MVKSLLAVVTLLCISIAAKAQDAALLRRIAENQQQRSTPISTRAANYFTLKDASELRLVLSGIVRAYQLLISSQDTDACNFEPSCSRFGMLAMQRFGVARGFLLTGDRLTRCNGATDRHYERSQQSGKHLDPVDTYDTYLSTNP